MKVLAVAADPEFLEELRNYLLSAGCREVAVAMELPAEVGELEARGFDAVVVDGSTDPGRTVGDLRRLRRAGLTAPVVVLGQPREGERPGGEPNGVEGVQWLLKHGFARNLLLILEEAGS